jgi:uncharacterized iron-regulated membrane protein
MGGLVSIVCLTGSVVMFRQEVERSRWPQNSVGAAPSHNWSLDAAAREIDRVQPGAVITRVRFPANSNDPYVFQIKSTDKQTHRMAVDASTGQVVGELPKIGWMDWLVDLHRNMLAGKTGRQVIGGVGGMSMALGATGLLLWVFGGGRWRAWVRIRGNGGSRRFNFDLHRVSGLWALLFIVVLAFTGMGLSYPQAFRNAWESVTGQPASTRPPQPAETVSIQTRSLDQYLATGRAAMPDRAPMELRISDSPKSATYLRLRRAGDLSPAGSNRVYFDRAPGSVLYTERSADWPLGVRLFQAFQPVHYGQFGGLPVKILWSLLGVTPVLLFVTGLLVWWRPTKPDPRRKARYGAPGHEVPREDPVPEPVQQKSVTITSQDCVGGIEPSKQAHLLERRIS